MSKICFTTSLYSSGNNFDTPGKFNRNPQYDYFLFTNIKGLQCDWDVINTENIKEISEISCNIRKSRYGKFLSWDIFHQIGKNYDYIVYCDAYITPKLTDWDNSLRKINDLDFAFMQRDHPDGNVRAGGIAQESQLIVNNGKDSYQSMSKTLSFFQNTFPSVPLQYPQYYENTVFAYKFNCEIFRKLSKEFWDIYTNEDITYRDQPLWNLLLLKNNIKPLVDNNFKLNFKENGNMYNGHVYPS